MSDARIPLLLYGDGPRLHSGLARIARDLAERLVSREEELGIRVAQVGVDFPEGRHWQSWDCWGFQPNDRDQGRDMVEFAALTLQEETGERPIVLMITDPARCFDLTRWNGEGSADPADALLTEWCDLWGYFPIDGHNVSEAIGGPAAKAVVACGRVLGYGRYGAGVLKRTLERIGGHTDVRVSYLPHGIDTRIFHPGVELAQADGRFQDWLTTHSNGQKPWVIGAVATNQPRKDLGLLFASVAELRKSGERAILWLHTDYLTKAWSVVQLATEFAFGQDEIYVSTHELPDTVLAARYAASDVTMAPGLGEGFGYPIVESLACGTPCIHGNYGGGPELIAQKQWLVEPYAWRLESCYAIQRPVFRPGDVAGQLLHAAQEKRQRPDLTAASMAGSVAHLDWKFLWPRWEAWVRQGLNARRSLGGHERTQ